MAITKKAVADAQSNVRTVGIERRLAALEANRRRQSLGRDANAANATQIQGVGVSATELVGGQVLQYDSASGLYVPATPPVTVAFIIPDGATGTDVALQDSAARAGSVKQCVVTVSASDAAVALTFKMKQNGTDVFSVDPTIAAGAAAGSKFTFTTLTSIPLAIAAGDLFSMDISSGSSSWKFVAKLE